MNLIVSGKSSRDKSVHLWRSLPLLSSATLSLSTNIIWFVKCRFIFLNRYLTFLSCTGILFIISMVAVIFFYKFFVRSAECRTNLFFVSLSLCQSVAATVVSVLPKVQEAQSGTGKWRHRIKNCTERRPTIISFQYDFVKLKIRRIMVKPAVNVLFEN